MSPGEGQAAAIGLVELHGAGCYVGDGWARDEYSMFGGGVGEWWVGRGFNLVWRRGSG
jgi:hypothetical protein